MRSHKARTAAATTLLTVLALVALLAGCGSDDGASAASSPAGPSAFADESYAELATDGEDGLWLAVAGYQRDGDFGLRVFKRESSTWTPLPSLPGKVSGDIPISLVVADDNGEPTPCIGYSLMPRQEATVACFAEEKWELSDLPSFRKGYLIQLGVEDGDLVALVAQQNAKQSRYRLIREEEESWTATPPVSAPPAVARLGIESPSAAAAQSPVIGFATQGRNSRHYALELRGGKWRTLQPTVQGVGAGPLVGGPILLHDRVFYPVNEADAEPWTFSVQTARIGASTDTRAERFSTGAGNAQGRLDLVGGRVWATWQEDDPLEDGRFRAAIYAAELTPDGQLQRKIRLWRGVSIGPGSTQVVEYEGKTLALYMRSSGNGRGLQATVKELGS
jgi:hypothetical protein